MFCGAANGHSRTREPQAEHRREPVVWAATLFDRPEEPVPMYQSRDQYLGLVTAAAQDLVKQRYLLETDVDDVVKRADEHWMLLAKGEK